MREEIRYNSSIKAVLWRREKMEAITNVITQIDTLVWGWWMILLLLGTGFLAMACVRFLNGTGKEEQKLWNYV